MTLAQFDHVCRAAAASAGIWEVYVFGVNALIPWLARAGYPVPLSDLESLCDVDVTVGDVEWSRDYRAASA